MCSRPLMFVQTGVRSKLLHIEGVPVGFTEMEDVVNVAGGDLISPFGSPNHNYSIDDVGCAGAAARSSG